MMCWILWKLGFLVRWRMSRPNAGRGTIYLGRTAKPDMIRACVAQVEILKADGWVVETEPPAAFTKSEQPDGGIHLAKSPKPVWACVDASGLAGVCPVCREKPDCNHSWFFGWPVHSGCMDRIVAIPK